MSAPNLTTLARVKTWLGIEAASTEPDGLLNTLISSASRFIYRYIDLPTVAVADYVELRDGYGNGWIRPYNWPLISVTSINYCGLSITESATGNPLNKGYTVNSPDYGPSRLTIHGYAGFPRGKDLIQLSYTAGFKITDEEYTIPVDPWQINTDSLWAGDIGVKDASLNDMTKVTGTPVSGEYAVSSLGVYQFAAADEGDTVYITYSFVPDDLAQAVTELVGQTYREKDRIGVRMKTLGGQETIAYWRNEISPHMGLLLQPFCRVTPR